MAFGFSISCFYLLPKHLTVSYAASPGQVGAVVGIFGLIPSALIVPWLGRTVSALGLPRTLFLAQLLMAASAFAFASLDGIGATMMVLRALQGLATAGFMTASMAMVCELAPAHRLGQAMGFAGAASLIMNAIAPAVAEPVGARYGFAWVFLLSGAAALVGALIARRLPQAAQPAEASTRPTFPRQAYTVLLAVAISSAGFYVVMAFLAPLALSRGIGAVGGFFVAYTIAALAMRTVGSAVTDRLGLGALRQAGHLHLRRGHRGHRGGRSSLVGLAGPGLRAGARRALPRAHGPAVRRRAAVGAGAAGRVLQRRDEPGHADRARLRPTGQSRRAGRGLRGHRRAGGRRGLGAGL